MIAELILNLIMGAFTGVFNIIKPLLPAVAFGPQIAQLISNILNISNQGLNFCHFIMGDSMAIVLPVIGGLMLYKYIVFPVLDVLRRLIPFVNL